MAQNIRSPCIFPMEKPSIAQGEQNFSSRQTNSSSQIRDPTVSNSPLRDPRTSTFKIGGPQFRMLKKRLDINLCIGSADYKSL